MKKKKMAAKSARWCGGRADEEEEECGWVGVGEMKKKSARWGGYREDEEDDGEECEVGWR